LEVEIDKMKRRWLASFSQPQMLTKDVCDVINPSAHNDMSAREDPVPDSGIFMYFFGFSCKDLSTLNNHSKSFKDDCITTGAGSTGVTWAGNLGFVEKCQPAMVIAENVPSALKGGNGTQIKQDLRDAGYRLATILSSVSDWSASRSKARMVCSRQKRPRSGELRECVPRWSRHDDFGRAFAAFKIHFALH
jgi:site-specific DNA-cytosine methylase